MPLTTLASARQSRLKRIASACPDSRQFLDLLNDATRELMNRGSWWGTVKKIKLCSYAGCLAWPKFVGTVLATNIAGKNRPVQGGWYEFMDLVGQDVNPNRIWPSNVVTVDDGTTPVFQNIPCGTPMYVQAYSRRSNDVGKTVTIYGIDYNGQVRMTTWPDGVYREGEVLTLTSGAPPAAATTGTTYREITRVSKDVTEGPVDLYYYDGTYLHEAAHYSPREMEPNYRHSTIQGWRSAGCCSLRTITALIKLQFEPVYDDNDVVLIENLDALALAMQSIKASDANDSDNAEKMMARAVHTLNLELENKHPLGQTPIYVSGFGTAVPKLAGIGRTL